MPWCKIIRRITLCKRLVPLNNDVLESAQDTVMSQVSKPSVVEINLMVWTMTRMAWERVAVTYGVVVLRVAEVLSANVTFQLAAMPLAEDLDEFCNWFVKYFALEISILKQEGDAVWEQKRSNPRYMCFDGLEGTYVEVCGTECRYDAIRFDWKVHGSRWVDECWDTCAGLSSLFLSVKFPLTIDVTQACRIAGLESAGELLELWLLARSHTAEDEKVFELLMQAWEMLHHQVENDDPGEVRVGFSQILDEYQPAMDVMALRMEFRARKAKIMEELVRVEGWRDQLMKKLSKVKIPL